MLVGQVILHPGGGFLPHSRSRRPSPAPILRAARPPAPSSLHQPPHVQSTQPPPPSPRSPPRIMASVGRAQTSTTLHGPPTTGRPRPPSAHVPCFHHLNFSCAPASPRHSICHSAGLPMCLQIPSGSGPSDSATLQQALTTIPTTGWARSRPAAMLLLPLDGADAISKLPIPGPHHHPPQSRAREPSPHPDTMARSPATPTDGPWSLPYATNWASDRSSRRGGPARPASASSSRHRRHVSRSPAARLLTLEGPQPHCRLLPNGPRTRPDGKAHWSPDQASPAFSTRGPLAENDSAPSGRSHAPPFVAPAPTLSPIGPYTRLA